MKEAVWDVDDIEGLAREVQGFEVDQYHDLQARQAATRAVERWPLLAEMCQAALEDDDDPPDPAAGDASAKQQCG